MVSVRFVVELKATLPAMINGPLELLVHVSLVLESEIASLIVFVLARAVTVTPLSPKVSVKALVDPGSSVSPFVELN